MKIKMRGTNTIKLFILKKETVELAYLFLIKGCREALSVNLSSQKILLTFLW